MHWSVLRAALAVVALSWGDPLTAGIAVLPYAGLILLHEAGHAWIARRIGDRP